MIDDGLRTRPVNMAEDDVDRAVEERVERRLHLIMSHHKSEAEAVRKRTIWESYAGMHHPY
jgi:hypothetical protein